MPEGSARDVQQKNINILITVTGTGKLFIP
jgi:hypothetical protein